jgi:hypothetical protein
MPRRGYTTQPGVFNPGGEPPKPHRALKERQTKHGKNMHLSAFIV